jgi:hypothetical protein
MHGNWLGKQNQPLAHAAGNPAMPEAELSPDQIHDLLTFLKTLE